MNPLISIIVPVRNGEKTIGKCLDSLINLNYSNFEIIVIDDGSVDKTPEILKKYNNIRILTTPGVGPSKARNIAVQKSKGEFLAFTDADCLVDTNWLNELLKGFTNEKVAGVGGDQQSPEDDTEFGKEVQNFFRTIGFVTGYIKSGKKTRETNHNPSCNVMYRRDIFEKLKGFEERLWPGEDVELDYRIAKANYRLMHNPKAVVYHYRPDTIAKLRRMMQNYGWSQGVITRKCGLFRVIQLEFPVLILILAFGIWLTYQNNFYGISFFVFLSLVPLFFFSARGQKPFLFYKFFLLTMLSWNYGFLRGIIRGS
ncbi:MAG: glycosyltransferase [Candidatus Edwardsbacteria bacterium]